MSHFKLIIVGDNVEKQLEPFFNLNLSNEKLKMDSRVEFGLEVAFDKVKEKRASDKTRN